MPKAKGQLEEGNLDPYRRERVLNPDGSYSTMKTMGFQDENGSHVIVPSVFEGGHHEPEQAFQRYKTTGEHFGKFASQEDMDAYDKQMHRDINARTELEKVSGDPNAMTPQFEELARFLREHNND